MSSTTIRVVMTPVQWACLFVVIIRVAFDTELLIGIFWNSLESRPVTFRLWKLLDVLGQWLLGPGTDRSTVAFRMRLMNVSVVVGIMRLGIRVTEGRAGGGSLGGSLVMDVSAGILRVGNVVIMLEMIMTVKNRFSVFNCACLSSRTRMNASSVVVMAG